VLDAALRKQAAGTFDEEYRIVRPDGTIRWIRDRAYPVRNDTGEVYRVAGVAEDVTERVNAVETMRRHLDELQRWYTVMLEREERVAAIKREVNDLLAQLGRPARYSSQQEAVE